MVGLAVLQPLSCLTVRFWCRNIQNRWSVGYIISGWTSYSNYFNKKTLVLAEDLPDFADTINLPRLNVSGEQLPGNIEPSKYRSKVCRSCKASLMSSSGPGATKTKLTSLSKSNSILCANSDSSKTVQNEHGRVFELANFL